MIRSGLILTSGNVAAALLGLVRNIVIARLVSVEDFGIASTFAITMALVEMASNFSLDRLVVQARDGDEPRLLSTLHAVQAIRGLLGTGVLFLVAGPVAALFGVPEVAWAYQALALVPFLRGLAHLDMFRRQREMQFVPSATVEVSAQMLSSLSALPLALWLGDWRAMLYALLIQQLVFTAASHWVALRPYRWSWDHGIVRRALRFGLPLLANGILMFGIFQGDRIIVGSLIGMTELGWFSAAFSLTLPPALVLASILNRFFLPQLSRLQDDDLAFGSLYPVVIEGVLLVGVVLLGLLAILGPSLLLALYGPRYEAALPFVVLLGAMQALRLAKAGPAIVALSRAEATNPLLANIVRAAALPVAWLVVWQGGGVTALVVTAILGEGLSLLAALVLLGLRMSLVLDAVMPSVTAGVVVVGLVVVDALVWSPGADPIANVHAFQAVIIVPALFMLWSMRPLRSWMRHGLVARKVPGSL
ncbi:MAG: oligosaccharide flippase family protein [bacterium]